MKDGFKIPKVTFRTRIGDEEETDGGCAIGGQWKNMTTDDYFKGKRVVLFSLPGAFTPTCSSQQLPGFEKEYNQIKLLAVDEVYCVSVNDSYVMNAWGKDLGIEKITLIPDGNGAITRQLGMLVDKPVQNFGQRSWRYSSYIVNGIVKKMFIEDGINNASADEDPYEESTPEKILDYVKSL